MEKYVRVYNPVTIVGVKYMEHVCSPDVSYKVPAFARVYNLPENLLPFYNAVKTDPNIDSGHTRMIDWEKIMNMDFGPISYPTNCSAYDNYFIESDSNPRKWDNDIVMYLLLNYNMEENPDISFYLKAGLAGKIEHIQYTIFNNLGILMRLAERYDRTWIKPVTSSSIMIPDDIRDAYNETMNGIAFYVANGKLYISKYGDLVSKYTNIIDILKNQIEEASKYAIK